MEILQINEELKLYIETLIKEKQTITKDFEVEFSRMNVSYFIFYINSIL